MDERLGQARQVFVPFESATISFSGAAIPAYNRREDAGVNRVAGAANMNVVQRIKCLWGRHRRDGRRVRYAGQYDYSLCTGCGRPMIRDVGRWRLAKPGEQLDEGI